MTSSTSSTKLWCTRKNWCWSDSTRTTTKSQKMSFSLTYHHRCRSRLSKPWQLTSSTISLTCSKTLELVALSSKSARTSSSNYLKWCNVRYMSSRNRLSLSLVKNLSISIWSSKARLNALTISTSICMTCKKVDSLAEKIWYLDFSITSAT